MDDSPQLTRWIRRLAGGEERAAEVVWQHYYDRLVRLASRALDGTPRRAADEEDVALSAMKSFCRGAAAGRFPRLDDRHDLWNLLVTITARKANKLAVAHRAQKRGEGRVRGESGFVHSSMSNHARGIEQVVGSEPTPEFACLVAETYAEMLARLGDETLERIAILKMEGYQNDEIAKEVPCALRTVERKLQRIRAEWDAFIPR